MRWSEISVYTSEEAMQAIADFLHDFGSGGVVVEDSATLLTDFPDRYGEIYELSAADYPEDGVRLKAYFVSDLAAVDARMTTSSEPGAAGVATKRGLKLPVGEIIRELKAELARLAELGLDVGSGQVELAEVADEDWAHSWKQYYKPVRISDRFIIRPTWEETPVQADELVIELDPGMAFGTGTHPTTVLSVQALEGIITGGERVIDVGCGTGVLSIAAAKLGANSVLALDIDPVAVASASHNVVLNKVDGQVTVREGDLLRGVNEPADVIVANILAEVIMLFTDDLARLLGAGGYFVGSGIIAGKAAAVVAALEGSGLAVTQELAEAGWVCVVARRA